MPNADYYPDEWKKYCRLARLKEGGVGPNWSQFAARYRVAAAFQYADFMRISSSTKDGYSAAIRFLLSYTAFEHCCRAAGVKSTSVRLKVNGEKNDGSLGKIRKIVGNAGEIFPLYTNAISDKSLIQALKNFLACSTDNFLPVCTALRHLIAHGSWTPRGIRIRNASDCEVFEILSHRLLTFSDDFLRNEIERLNDSC